MASVRRSRYTSTSTPTPAREDSSGVPKVAPVMRGHGTARRVTINHQGRHLYAHNLGESAVNVEFNATTLKWCGERGVPAESSSSREETQPTTKVKRTQQAKSSRRRVVQMKGERHVHLHTDEQKWCSVTQTVPSPPNRETTVLPPKGWRGRRKDEVRSEESRQKKKREAFGRFAVSTTSCGCACV